MLKLIRHIYLLASFLVGVSSVSLAQQQGIYVPKKAKLFFSADTSTIFSDVINQGNFGVGRNAVVNFKGKKWENDSEGQITDQTNDGTGTAGVGGLIRFIADGMRQQITGGYNAATKTGASFYNLQIQNSLGVELLDGNAKVRNEIILAHGLVYLNTNILSIGNNNPGIINGYNENRFFVTGNQIGNGALVRENITNRSGLVTFPVGTRSGAYTPAAVTNKAARGDDFFVNVFDSTKAGLTLGRNLASEGVNKTWEVGKILHPNDGEVELYLQHQNKEEGIGFANKKSNSYISQFVGGVWDEIYPQVNPGAGFLTTSSVQTNSGTNSRNVRSVSNRSFFTKLIGKGNSVETKLWFNAFRIDKDNVRALWKTNPEVNVQYFVVQRRLVTETEFKSVATVSSKVPGGISLSPLDYNSIDANNYTGVSFYRLLMVHHTNDSTYSNIVAVGAKSGPYNIMLWPNPTPDKFFITLNTSVPVKSVAIFNVLGQKMYETNVLGQAYSEIQGHHLIPGTYFVSLIGVPGTILETKKLIIAKY